MKKVNMFYNLSGAGIPHQAIMPDEMIKNGIVVNLKNEHDSGCIDVVVNRERIIGNFDMQQYLITEEKPENIKVYWHRRKESDVELQLDYKPVKFTTYNGDTFIVEELPIIGEIQEYYVIEKNEIYDKWYIDTGDIIEENGGKYIINTPCIAYPSKKKMLISSTKPHFD